MKKVALIYWPQGGSVERCANIINDKLQDCNVEFHCLEDVKAGDLAKFDSIVLGGSTVGADHWSNDQNQDEWTFLFSEMEKEQVDLKDKTIALFGLGNQMLYPNHFVDGMITIKKAFEKFGVKTVGPWPTDGYDFNESQAIEDDKFVGLALDEDSQPELTEERIDEWLHMIKKDIA
ncbi:flavodoxin [Puteibacter caeruleilacunae]|nr:flavodoxin [Puteibacter caeruleilacunae]